MFRVGTGKLIELLEAQATALAAGNTESLSLLALYPDVADRARPLMTLASMLASALLPVRPRPAYRSRLQRGLVDAAQSKRALPAMSPQPVTHTWRPWVLGAATIGSIVSVVGVIAYLLHARQNGRMEQVVQ